MPSYQYIFSTHKLAKSYGDKQVIKDVSLSFLPDAKIGIVGVNGAGKSTLLHIMAGEDQEYSGEARLAEGAKVGYLPQEPRLDETKNVWENICAEIPEKQLLERFNEVSTEMAEDYSDELMEEMTSLQEKIDAADAWDIDLKIEMAMSALNCPPKEEGVAHLSGGEKRRVAICRLLMSKPDMILLDEPTNHLDAETVDWLENYLKNFPGCVIMITHDRYFLDNITNWTLEIDRGRGIPYEGNYSAWLEQKAKRLEQEAREEAGKKKILAKELDWIRQGTRGRHAKQKARIRDYQRLRDEADHEKITTAQIRIPPGPRLGGNVIEVKGLNKAFGDKLLIKDLEFTLPPGGVVGVIGPNGAGKSTLFKMLIGQETPDSGSVKIGETVKMSNVDQSRDALADNKTVWEEISGGTDVLDLGGVEIQSRAYVGAFNFMGSDQQKKLKDCSGGCATGFIWRNSCVKAPI